MDFKMKTSNFQPLCEDEMRNLDGGEGFTIAVIAAMTSLFVSGLAAGVAVGLNRVNRTEE